MRSVDEILDRIDFHQRDVARLDGYIKFQDKPTGYYQTLRQARGFRRGIIQELEWVVEVELDRLDRVRGGER